MATDTAKLMPIFWLWPRMTSNLRAFSTAAKIYLVIGSLHEEARLREAFGDDYDAYLNCGVSLCVLAPKKCDAEFTSAVANLEVTPQ